MKCSFTDHTGNSEIHVLIPCISAIFGHNICVSGPGAEWPSTLPKDRSGPRVSALGIPTRGIQEDTSQAFSI